jgi:peptidoglycan/LPS O-acetylase OafA/YrhL
VALALALLLAAVVFPGNEPKAPRLTRMLEVRALVFAGLISYSVFLWHEPMIHWLEERGLTLEGWDGFVVNLAMTLIVVGILSTATYRLVELPALRRKHRTRERPSAMDEAQLEAAP